MARLLKIKQLKQQTFFVFLCFIHRFWNSPVYGHRTPKNLLHVWFFDGFSSVKDIGKLHKCKPQAKLSLSLHLGRNFYFSNLSKLREKFLKVFLFAFEWQVSHNHSWLLQRFLTRSLSLSGKKNSFNGVAFKNPSIQFRNSFSCILVRLEHNKCRWFIPSFNWECDCLHCPNFATLFPDMIWINTWCFNSCNHNCSANVISWIFKVFVMFVTFQLFPRWFFFIIWQFFSFVVLDIWENKSQTMYHT